MYSKDSAKTESLENQGFSEFEAVKGKVFFTTICKKIFTCKIFCNTIPLTKERK